MQGELGGRRRGVCRRSRLSGAAPVPTRLQRQQILADRDCAWRLLSQVAYHISEDVPRVLLGDAQRLQQILLNILNNSVGWGMWDAVFCGCIFSFASLTP